MCDNRECRLSVYVRFISGELVESFETTVSCDLYSLQGRVIRLGQSHRSPQERREAVCAGKSRQGNSQLLADPHRFMCVRICCGLAQCFQSQ